MSPSAADLGPARLRALATAAKLEALVLASEWGTPLTPILGLLAEAFQGPLAEVADQVIRGWEGDFNDLGNCLFRLCSACEAAADEEEAIARAVAGGFPSPNRYQDLAAAFLAWERRDRRQRPFIAPAGGGGGFVAIHPDRVRHAAQRLLDAGDGFDAGYRRLSGPFRDAGLEPPEELRWVVEGCQRLAAELRQRADAFEAAEAQVAHAAAAALSGLFSGLLTPLGKLFSNLKTESAEELQRRAAADAKRLIEELRTGLFDLADFEKGRKLLAEAERASRDNPAYAAAFLRALGPDKLRWLIEQGQLDPCVLGALVARASNAGIGTDFLTKALGNDGFDAPRRAALLTACRCPTALFNPAWVERMTVTLLKGRDPAGSGDPRKWYREAAANLLATHPAGAIQFINGHQKLACSALFSHNDKGGRTAQAAVDDMLLNAPPGQEKEAEDALERVTWCAAEHEFSPEGKRTLARLLARPSTLNAISRQVAVEVPRPVLPGDRGFGVGKVELRKVLSDLMLEGEARRTLLDAANQFATERLTSALAAPNDFAMETALKETGALFGALASRSYSLQAALDVQKMAADTAKSLVEAVGGTALELAKAHPVVSLVVEGGSAIVFDVSEASADRLELARDLERELRGVEAQEYLKGDLRATLEHRAFVSVLTDPDERAALGLRLSAADLPEVPADLNLPVANREEWARHLFDPDGNLVVPQPSDPARWRSFIGWTEAVNPDLGARVSALTNPMFQSFEAAVRA